VPVGLKPLLDTFADTREALHRVAEELVAPARKPHNEIALRQTPGGFGTPEFEFEGRRMQVRVEGDELVLAGDGSERRTRLASIADGARSSDPGCFRTAFPRIDARSGSTRSPRARLADFYAFDAEFLERFRSALPPHAAPSSINLWPEHFDIATEAGSEEAGLRANYGASPGDEDHQGPYVYVGPWTAEVEGALWNARGFRGTRSSPTLSCSRATIRWQRGWSSFGSGSRRWRRRADAGRQVSCAPCASACSREAATALA
jgi:hypothetical protein